MQRSASHTRDTTPPSQPATHDSTTPARKGATSKAEERSDFQNLVQIELDQLIKIFFRNDETRIRCEEYKPSKALVLDFLKLFVPHMGSSLEGQTYKTIDAALEKITPANSRCKYTRLQEKKGSNAKTASRSDFGCFPREDLSQMKVGENKRHGVMENIPAYESNYTRMQAHLEIKGTNVDPLSRTSVEFNNNSNSLQLIDTLQNWVVNTQRLIRPLSYIYGLKMFRFLLATPNHLLFTRPLNFLKESVNTKDLTAEQLREEDISEDAVTYVWLLRATMVMTPEECGVLREFRFRDGELEMELPIEVAERYSNQEDDDAGEHSTGPTAEKGSLDDPADEDGGPLADRGEKTFVKVHQVPYRDFEAFGRHPRYYSYEYGGKRHFVKSVLSYDMTLRKPECKIYEDLKKKEVSNIPDIRFSTRDPANNFDLKILREMHEAKNVKFMSKIEEEIETKIAESDEAKRKNAEKYQVEVADAKDDEILDDFWRGLLRPQTFEEIYFEVEYDPLKDFDNVWELVVVMRDAIKCYLEAYTNAGLMHRDISESNIWIDRTDPSRIRGRLGDWNCAIKRNSASMERSQTGTARFMSYFILATKNRKHSCLDDCESFFWVFLYNLLRCTLPKEQEKDGAQVQKLFDGDEEVKSHYIEYRETFDFSHFMISELDGFLSYLQGLLCTRYKNLLELRENLDRRKGINDLIQRTIIWDDGNGLEILELFYEAFDDLVEGKSHPGAEQIFLDIKRQREYEPIPRTLKRRTVQEEGSRKRSKPNTRTKSTHA